MTQNELKFSSINEAIQYLADETGEKVIVAALTPSKGDLVIIYHPLTHFYHVLVYPGDKAGSFHKSDAVKDMRAKVKEGNRYVDNPAYGEPMTFDGETSPTQMSKEISNMIAGLEADKRKQLKFDDMAGVYLADNLLDTDAELGPGQLDFQFAGSDDGRHKQRVYHAIGRSGVIKSDKRLIKDRIEEEKSLSEQDRKKLLELIKKNPKRYKEKVEKAIDSDTIPALLHDISKVDLQKIFASSEEALQYLSDITGKVVRISK